MEGSKTQLSLGNYLIDDKQNKISFFRHGYKNYQNFVRDTRYIPLNNALSFGKSKRMSCLLPKMKKTGWILMKLSTLVGFKLFVVTSFK